MPVPWNDDPPGTEPQILSNATAVLQSVADRSDKRDAPTVGLAQDWHRRLYAGVRLPVAYYAGELRDSDARFPELDGYEVSVGVIDGAPSANVPTEVAIFEGQAQIAVSRIDAAIPVGARPAIPPELEGVVRLCARMHGEWVRIHPFANGNGRTARLWANWVALRYGLPPFVTIKPRPADPYRVAAAASMRGHHEDAFPAFAQLLREVLLR